MATLKRYVFLLLLSLPVLAGAQRLPQAVIPDHYDLTFTPDLQKATFAGEETIDVKVLARTSSVTLNAAEIEIQEASITQGDNTRAARPSFHPEKEQVTLATEGGLEPGLASIHIKFS